MLEKLNHLSEEQVAELIKKYYSGAKSYDLINEFNLDILPNQIHKTFPPKILSNKCIRCSGNMVEPYPSKTSYNSRWGSAEIAFCIICGHKQSGYCACDGCQEASRLAIRQKAEQEATAKQEFQQQLESTLANIKPEKISYESLSFNQKVYLGAVIRGGIDEGFNIIKPSSSLYH